MLKRNTFKNKTIEDVLEDAKEGGFQFKKSYVSGYSILMVESENKLTSFPYYDDEKSRDEDFDTIENILK